MGCIVTDSARVNEFVRRYVPGESMPGFRAIGVERDGQIVAGVLYENFNDSNVWCHVAAEPGGHSMTKDFIRAILAYPFVQLGLRRISAYVKASNSDAIKFLGSLGFRVEATLEEAGDGGEDMLVFVLKKQECRYV